MFARGISAGGREAAKVSRRMLKRTGLVLAAVAFSLCLFELYLRILPPKEFARIESLGDFIQMDDLLGYRLRPNMRGHVLSEDGVNDFLVETNEHGLREDPYRGKEGKQNVLGLGDSFLYGDSVEKEQALMDQIRKRLDEKFAGRFRTINAGVPGYSTNQEALYYLLEGEPAFDPDVVILFFYINDVVIYIDTRPRFREGIPLPDMVRTNKEVLPVIWTKEPKLRMVKFFRYWNNKRAGPQDVSSTSFRQTPDLQAEAQMFNTEWRSTQTVRWENLESILAILHERVRANGAKLLLVYLPSARESEDGPSRGKYYRTHSYPVSMWDWDRPSKVVERMAERLDIPCLNLVPVFQNHWRSTGRSLHINRDGHFTEEGHILAADAVFPKLRDILGKNEDSGKSVSAERDRNEPDDDADAGRLMSPVPGKRIWGGVGEDIRRILVIPSDTFYEKEVVQDPRDPFSRIRFSIHPQSSDVAIDIRRGDRGHERRVIAPDILWRDMAIPLERSDPSAVHITIRALSDTVARAVVTPPMGIKPGSRRRPPVVLISIGSLRTDRVSSMPALAEFSQTAAVFDDATAASPWTLPSHMSMLTGCDPYTHHVGMDTAVLPSGIPTMASILGNAGYVTAAVTGGDELLRFDLGDFQSNREFKGGAAGGDIEFHRPAVLEWIRNHAGDAFFLFYHTNAVSQSGSSQARYDEGVSRVDRMVSDIFSELRRLGLFDPSLIIVTADHGAESGEGKRFHQDRVHVPLLIKVPNRRGEGAPSRIREPVGSVDILPTVLDVVGLPMPQILDGQSLRPVIQNGDVENGRGGAARLFLLGAVKGSGDPGATAAIRFGDYKLLLQSVIGMDGIQFSALACHDLRSDTGEIRNLLTTHAGLVKDLKTTFVETALFRFRRLAHPGLRMPVVQAVQ